MWNPADPVVSSDDVRTCGAECSIVDCRFDLARPDWGRQEFLEAHVPGARYAHLDHDLADLAISRHGRHPLPDTRATLRLLGRLGVEPNRPLVVYDQGAGAIAARLWWMARDAGHHESYLMDGGFAHWLAAGHPVESGPCTYSASSYPGHRGHMPTISIENLAAALESHNVILVDARDGRRYAGIEEPIDRIPGHIPGAVNIPFKNNIGADGLWRSAAQIAADWGHVHGVDLSANTPIVMSCGSGVTACHNIAALTRCGVRSTLFAPSYSGWLEQENPRVATGSESLRDY